MRLIPFCLAMLMLAGCAHTGENRLAERDPLEGLNRGVWTFNRTVDRYALKPVTMSYRTVAPKPARRGLSQAFTNLSEPFSFFNNLLQLKPGRALRNLERFTINSTIGVGGLADHASGMGVAPAEEDFGETLAVWGANGGPYLVLPLIGPSTLRDAVGDGVAFLTDPYQVTKRNVGMSSLALWGIMGGEAVLIRSDAIDAGTDAFLESSLDPYAAARSAFLQRRAAQISDTENDPSAGAADETVEESAAEPADAASEPELKQSAPQQ